jgi:hypothetical protein
MDASSAAAVNPLVLAGSGGSSAALPEASAAVAGAGAPAGAALDDDEPEAGGGKGGKSALVLAAEACDRSRAAMRGWLRKKNSQEKWQKRWFELVDHYWVYYKSDKAGQPLLCAMDLWRAGTPALEAPAAAGGETGGDFSITWDRFRACGALLQLPRARAAGEVLCGAAPLSGAPACHPATALAAAACALSFPSSPKHARRRRFSRGLARRGVALGGCHLARASRAAAASAVGRCRRGRGGAGRRRRGQRGAGRRGGRVRRRRRRDRRRPEGRRVDG